MKSNIHTKIYSNGLTIVKELPKVTQLKTTSRLIIPLPIDQYRILMIHFKNL